MEVILPVHFVPSSPAAPVHQTLADELGDLTKCLGSPQPSHQYASRSNSFSIPSSVDSLSMTADGCDSASDESSLQTPPSASPIIPERRLGFEPCDAHGRRKFTVFAAEDNLIARRLLTALFTEQKVSRSLHFAESTCADLARAVRRATTSSPSRMVNALWTSSSRVISDPTLLSVRLPDRHLLSSPKLTLLRHLAVDVQMPRKVSLRTP